MTPSSETVDYGASKLGGFRRKTMAPLKKTLSRFGPKKRLAEHLTMMRKAGAFRSPKRAGA